MTQPGPFTWNISQNSITVQNPPPTTGPPAIFIGTRLMKSGTHRIQINRNGTIFPRIGALNPYILPQPFQPQAKTYPTISSADYCTHSGTIVHSHPYSNTTSFFLTTRNQTHQHSPSTHELTLNLHTGKMILSENEENHQIIAENLQAPLRWYFKFQTSNMGFTRFGHITYAEPPIQSPNETMPQPQELPPVHHTVQNTFTDVLGEEDV